MARMEPQAFIDWLAPAAQRACEKYKLPASVMIAQGCLESGWGQYSIGEYNILGRKYNGTGNYIEVPTQEYINGQYVTITDKFQDYKTLDEACIDWCILMTEESVYAPATAALPDKAEFIYKMGSVYATDPDYANKIIQIINANNLSQYDSKELGGVLNVKNKPSTKMNSASKTTAPSDDGFHIDYKIHGKHTDSIIHKLPRNKTFCEPVYPDLITIMDKVPPWLFDKANMPIEKLIVGDKLFYTIPTSALKEIVGTDIDAILGSSERLKERQLVFDAKKFKTTTKKMNLGKPANNNDPFPVDLKIEELELHQPRVKVYTLTVCPDDVELAKAVLMISDRTEKRLVRLENNMATLMRYLFRLGSRVNINCVYYGGQSIYEKYKSIRCMHHDRMSDGQTMSIDQCLSCTRYEPVLGQIYDILSETGLGLAQVLDDNQMSYMTMDDYIKFSRVEEFNTEKPKAKFDMAKVTVQNKKIKSFKEIWPQGFKMKWNYVPVEDQKPLINWRQSVPDDINDKKLDSYQNSEQNRRYPVALPSGSYAIMKKNADAMDASNDALLIPNIENGKAVAASLDDDAINRLKKGLDTDIRKLTAGTEVDPVIIAAIMSVERSSNAQQTIDQYNKAMSELGAKNSAIIISAYNAGSIVFNGKESAPVVPRIDRVVKTDIESTTTGFNLVWGNKENWLWTEFAEPLSINAQTAGVGARTSVLDFFPAVCYTYLKLMELIRSSKFDGDRFAFPFLEDQLSKVWYVSKYGMRQLDSEAAPRMHYGIDLATGEAGRGLEIHAIADGIVVDGSGWEPWNGVLIQHADNYFSRYLHNASVTVQAGQQIKRGEVIATVGDVGSPGAYHLHLEIGQGDVYTGQQEDPVIHYPALADKYGDGETPIGG